MSNTESTEKAVEGRKFSKAKDLSRRLGVCSKTLFNWSEAGKIKRYKITGGTVLFDETEVIAFVESAKV
jgi:predicted site-specific integrase-resolvase